MTTVRTVSSNPASPFYNANAPTLSGTAGTLVSVLDGVLVSGFTGFTALGWTTAYTGTNQRQYKNSAVDGTGSQLYIDDSGPGGAGAAEARATGFVTGTALGAGTNQFPTFAEINIGIGAIVIRKSSTANSTVRYYTIVGDDTCFYLFTESGDYTSPNLTSVFMFGDIFSYKTNDAYRCIIIGRNSENNNYVTNEWSTTLSGLQGGQNGNILSYTLGGHYMAANFTGIGGSISVGKHTDQIKMGVGGFGVQGLIGGTTTIPGTGQMCLVGNNCANSGYFPYPNAPDGGLYIAPIWIHHNNFVRGYLKGLWAPLQNLPLNHNDTYNGSGPFAGKSFLAQAAIGDYNNNPNVAQFHVETSSTWS